MQKQIKLLDILIDKDQIDQDQDICFLCKDLVTMPIQCTKCHIPYCFKCGNKNKQCLKCKSNWNSEPMEIKQFKLKCPFSEECQFELSPQNFIVHIMSSEHVDEQIKELYHSQFQNLCQKGHSLTLLVDNFKNLTHQQCNDCKKVGLARQQCQECNVIYCVLCRPIHFKDKQCDQGHKLSHVVPKQNLPFLCDRCGKNKKNPEGYYVDKKCNIGICEECFETLS